MMRAYERFLKYVKIDTTSADDVSTAPTTACQWDLAKLLVKELGGKVQLCCSGSDCSARSVFAHGLPPPS